MDGELAGLATSGATTLVGLMATDAWTQVRRRLAAFLGHGDPAARDQAEAELVAAQEELAAAREVDDEEAAADVEAAWRSALRRRLRADPGAAAELRALLREFATELGEGAAGGSVVNTVNVRTQSGTIVQGRDFWRPTFYGSAAGPVGTTRSTGPVAAPGPDAGQRAEPEPEPERGTDGEPGR